MNANKESVFKIISNVLEISIDSITEETGPDNVENWDSFNALMLISEFESEFDLKFTIPEVEHVANVRDILNVLENKGVNCSDEE
jgi:acyl carrier protein